MCKTILIVEDEMINALFLKHLIQLSGYKCCGIVTRGDDAIKKALELNPDLILMDIFLSDNIDGIQASEYIHKQKFIPIIFITASSDKETYERAQSVKYNAFLRKPFNNEELTTQIVQTLKIS
ncbi:MAG: hypothetical protein A2086_07260 [Spirochaetes bacterium GWD1_27_9]|nr:MAG: hypothetical protein A2Z98_11705 [Spirochaetes bacterium GWB1_27_13]OHD22028.1 MAG: hypothetical protein A2Y34_06840 [Spirochaetes bacterium GWC1_27_15]OHD32199.1 MAG: hypothetical protein A2086_07260 [Spirochaetes bacterium GWD1_27_9]